MTKEEAIEYLEKLYMIADITDEYGYMDDTEPYETAIDMAVEALKERKIGKWISRKNELKHQDWWMCSECSGQFDYKWKYCPNCGVKMEE